MLRSEGFTDIHYVETDSGPAAARSIARGEFDFTTNFAPPLIIAIDAGEPITIVGGLHAGCYELFGTERVKSIRDLKGKTVAIPELGSAHHIFLSGMAAYVGVDPARDINFVFHPTAESMQLLAEGKIDALIGFPPVPQELRARRIGHVIMNSAIDRPWSQYYCCMLTGNKEFVRRNPVATKRVLRAILKAIDLCVTQPERVARQIVDAGFTPRYDYALQTLRELPYAKWRDYDAEDTVRFYSLRLREAGMIRSNPNKIIADGTNWRFFNELRRELKT
jgi:NitT/TauT family transport system substrate-binding protein